MADKAPYESPTVVEYGSLQELTLGSGCDWLDFTNGQIGNDGNILNWGCRGGGS